MQPPFLRPSPPPGSCFLVHEREREKERLGRHIASRESREKFVVKYRWNYAIESHVSRAFSITFDLHLLRAKQPRRADGRERFDFIFTKKLLLKSEVSRGETAYLSCTFYAEKKIFFHTSIKRLYIDAKSIFNVGITPSCILSSSFSKCIKRLQFPASGNSIDEIHYTHLFKRIRSEKGKNVPSLRDILLLLVRSAYNARA